MISGNDPFSNTEMVYEGEGPFPGFPKNVSIINPGNTQAYTTNILEVDLTRWEN